MILDFDIVFDHPNKVHFSGDNVTGHVLLKLKNSLPLRSVLIRFIGESKYRIPKECIPSYHGKLSKKKTRRKALHLNNKVSPAPNDLLPSKQEFDNFKEKRQREMKINSETFFDKKVYLFGHKYSSYREHLSAGAHKLPFQYTLPASLPASYNGQFSYIRYYCEAQLERWASPTEKKRAYFSVSQIADLNNEPKADMSYSSVKTANCWLLCCPRGTIVVSTRLDRIGVVPGQLVPLETDIHNMSNMYIPETFISIIQVTSHYSDHGVLIYEDERMVCISKKGRILQGDFVIISDSLIVPPLPPTSFGHISCKLISINYKLQVHVDFARGNSNPIIINMPLIIGNIPLKKDFKKFEKSVCSEKECRIEMPNIFKAMPDFPAVWSALCENPLQSDCTYSLQKFIPRYPSYKVLDSQIDNFFTNSNNQNSNSVLPPVDRI